jgi:hypothetical protein
VRFEKTNKELGYMPPPTYEIPPVPEGFDQHCAFRYPDGEIVLDFVNHERRDFASESIDVEILWPWKDGYVPTQSDWESLGFLTLQA